MRPFKMATNTDRCEAYMRLFRVCPIIPIDGDDHSALSFEDLLTNGIVFVGENGDVLSQVPSTIGRLAITVLGVNDDYFNRTFYRTFDVVAKASLMQLYFDQISHYLNTYGRESEGLQAIPTVPGDLVDISSVTDQNICSTSKHITVIKMVSEVDASVYLNLFLSTVAAPTPLMVKLVKSILDDCTLAAPLIKSYELSALQHCRLNTQPDAYSERLRMVLYLLTGDTLLIKSEKKCKDIVQCIKIGHNLNPEHFEMATKMVQNFEIEGMATIFYRYKPLFLTLKKLEGGASIINRIRRAAKHYHTPENFFVLKNFFHPDLPLEAANSIIQRASNRELVKLINAFNATTFAETSDNNLPRVFAIRNGKIFIGDAPAALTPDQTELKTKKMVLLSNFFFARMKSAVEGKTFLIPSHIDYAVPTTEKQFVGVFPYGSVVHSGVANTPFTVGIHWENDAHARTDLDLHLNSITEHFGWNGDYRDETCNIVYSGDVTDAPRPMGATEAFFFDPNKDTYAVSVNKYCGEEGSSDYKFFLSTADRDAVVACSRDHRNARSNAIYQSDKLLTPAIPLTIGDKGEDDCGYCNENLGIFHEGVFYFYGGETSQGCVPRANYENFIKGIIPQITHKLRLTGLLIYTGANVIDQLEFDEMTAEEQANVINLSPEAIDCTTLMQIVDGTI